jgi:putative DNA primase/helicase
MLGTPTMVVDLRTGQARKQWREDRILRSTTVDPAPGRGCPLWLKFLKEATGGDQEYIDFLQRYCGYALTGLVREHAILFIYGAGGNGKSVFIKTLANILGDYHYKLKKEILASSETMPDRSAEYWLANLHRIRLVTVSEIEGKWAEATLKDMTGGDIIAARRPGGEPFNFPPEFKPIISGNNAPAIEDRSPAMKRRIKVGPFDHAPEIPDLDLEEKLKPEYPGILAWFIEGAVKCLKNGPGLLRRSRPRHRHLFPRRRPLGTVAGRVLRPRSRRKGHRLHSPRLIQRLAPQKRRQKDRPGNLQGTRQANSWPHSRRAKRCLLGLRHQPQNVRAT